jgi:hypothetical protein
MVPERLFPSRGGFGEWVGMVLVGVEEQTQNSTLISLTADGSIVLSRREVPIFTFTYKRSEGRSRAGYVNYGLYEVQVNDFDLDCQAEVVTTGLVG